MAISSISAYSQLQAWHASQKALTDDLLGSTSSSSTTSDFSSAFTSVAASFYSSSANITAQAAVSRIQSNIQLAYSNGDVASDFGATAAKTAGNAILNQLGYAGYGTNTATSNGTYSAPTNSATGKAYVKTSAASLNNLNSLNLFA
jgi:hypothetical protein